VRDGNVIADVAEERFTRVKHHGRFPSAALQACLEIGGITPAEVDVVAVATVRTEPMLNYFLCLDGARREHPTIGNRVSSSLRKMAGRATEKPPIYVGRFQLSPKAEVVHVDHHLAHAASAYYTCGSTSPQLIVTMDGVGDNDTSIGIWRGEGGKITLLKRFGSNGSLGWFYGNVTEALGWYHGDGEGKTMGLAPYGEPDKARGVLDPFYPKYANGDLAEPHAFGIPYVWNDNGAYQWHFDEAEQIHALIQRHGREHVAAEAQRVLEEQAAQIIFPWLEREGLSDLCCAGGVFLNVKLNQRIWESGKVRLHHIYPNAGDAGLAVGAALQAYHSAHPSAPIGSMDHLYLGPEYSDEEIARILDARGLTYRRVDDPAVEAGRLLADNKIVAWFQGRMESGPRALGGRSILMSPLRAENKDIINARVKFREAFRPFCPSLLAEKAEEYLVRCRPERFMITSFDAQPGKRDAVPAVVHVDGTLRPQTVDREINPLYWEAIKAFGDATGEYMVLNTSFNIKNEPIVCHPREAIRCFFDTGLDHLIMGSYVLDKK
jgi:carbamoyltransferase